MKIIITGGGTGGHIYPGISLARELQNRDKNNEIVFVGAQNKIESDIIPKEGIPFLGIKVKGIERKIGLESLHAVFLFIASLSTSYKIIKTIKPDLVIGTGGYVSGSIALISSIIGIPTFIHEQNVSPGITNQFLSLTSKMVFTSFPESKKYFWKKSRVACLGNPIRKNIWLGDKSKLIKQYNLDSRKKTIFVFGGSKGANTINKIVLEAMELIDQSLWLEWQVLIVSGKETYKNLLTMVEKSKYKNIIYVIPYLYQIEDAYDLADLVVCRAGATTLAELTAKGIAAVIVPYPYATGNHQLYNARYLENNSAAQVIIEKDLNKENMLDKLIYLMRNDNKRHLLAENSKKLGQRNAAENIVNAIYSCL